MTGETPGSLAARFPFVLYSPDRMAGIRSHETAPGTFGNHVLVPIVQVRGARVADR